MHEIFIDGATVGHNGKLGTVKHVGLGVFIKPNIKLHMIEDGISNNEAEFKALIWGMKEALKRDIAKATFFSDSMIIVNRANGRKPKKAKFKNERMDNFQNTVLDLAKKFKEVRVVWIPREQNETADALSKKAVWEVLY